MEQPIHDFRVEDLLETAREVIHARREASTTMGNTLPLKVAQAVDRLARVIGEPEGPAPIAVRAKHEIRRGCDCVLCREERAHEWANAQAKGARNGDSSKSAKHGRRIGPRLPPAG